MNLYQHITKIQNARTCFELFKALSSEAISEEAASSLIAVGQTHQTCQNGIEVLERI